MYYRARYYHAQLGRFGSRDPIGYAARDASLYSYVRNSPTILVDPSGLDSMVIAAASGQLPSQQAAERRAAQRLAQKRAAEIQRVERALLALCDCECLECSEEECKQEVARIAQAYAKMFHDKKRFQRFRLTTNHYRKGWMCYQWQTHTYNALAPIVTQGKCFDISRVGFVKSRVSEEQFFAAGTSSFAHSPGGVVSRTLEHNWVAISAQRGAGNAWGRTPSGECTLYLDPWKGEGPAVYPSDDPSRHVGHNFMVTEVFAGNADSDVPFRLPEKPSGVGGFILPSDDGSVGPQTANFSNGWDW